MRLTKFLLISAKCEFKKLVLNYIIPLVIISKMQNGFRKQFWIARTWKRTAEQAVQLSQSSLNAPGRFE
jgi:hypothetical protein